MGHGPKHQHVVVLAAVLAMSAATNALGADAPTPGATPPLQWEIAIIVGILILVGVLFWLSSWSDILRDAEPRDFGGATAMDGSALRRPFSLAQAQMTWWFVLVLGAYALLYVIKHDPNLLTAQALTLMGIGTGTALGATLVERNKVNPTLQAFQDTLKQLADLRAQGIPEAALAKLLAQRDLLARRLASHDFLVDILTDVDGISLHRLQSAVWTLLIGVIFLAEVVRHYAMPSLDPTVLAVLGISGGTYIGFKIPEQPN